MRNSRRLTKMVRVTILVLVVYLVLPVGCILAFITISNLYVRVGRISEFQPLLQNTQIPNTDYSLILEPPNSEYDDKVILVNNSDGVKIPIWVSESKRRRGFTILYHRTQIYLIMEEEISGSAGGYQFGVWNITGTKAYRLCTNCGRLDSGWSCTFPRLINDSLEFEVSDRCDKFPFSVLFSSGKPVHRYRIELN